MGRYRWKLHYCFYVFAHVDKKCNIFVIFTLASPSRITWNYATAEASLHLFCECWQSRWQITIVQPVTEREVWIGYRPAPNARPRCSWNLMALNIFLREKKLSTVRSNRLRSLNSHNFWSNAVFILQNDLSEKLVETRVWGCLNRQKEKQERGKKKKERKIGIYNSESKVPACNSRCHFPASECRM